jgi:hypothetical protein
MLVFGILRKWQYSQRDDGLEVQAPLDPEDSIIIYCCSTFLPNQLMFIIMCGIRGWVFSTYISICALLCRVNFQFYPIPSPLLCPTWRPETGIRFILLGLHSCWHGLYSVSVLLTKICLVTTEDRPGVSLLASCACILHFCSVECHIMSCQVSDV